MPQHYSRAHWIQITKRIKKANYLFSTKWKCFVCGVAFTSAMCSHTLDDNEEVVARAKSEVA